MDEILPETFPSGLGQWITEVLSLAPRFQKLRVLVSHLGFVPTCTAILEDADGYGVLSHSTGVTLAAGIVRAVAEANRIALMAAKAEPSRKLAVPSTPEDHALYYALKEKLPRFLFGRTLVHKDAERSWKSRQVRDGLSRPRINFMEVRIGNLFVVRAKSDEVQDLYFGETQAAVKNGWVNVARVSQVPNGSVNFRPHCVP